MKLRRERGAIPWDCLMGPIGLIGLVGCSDLTVPVLGQIAIEATTGTSGGAPAGDAGTFGETDGADAGSCVSTPSCQVSAMGTTNCGAGSATECCCASLDVEGGTFERTYTSEADGGPKGLTDPATVGDFRLDKYDVTVGRFRQFVSAWNAGYAPPAGSGKHIHLNGGLGLANGASPGTYEPGWVASDDVNVMPTSTNLACVMNPTWTDLPSDDENQPINCMNWYEAYAFCIWDGGFLPSEAEWEYAAAGGSQQREYPWGALAPGTTNAFAIYGCLYPKESGKCTGTENIAPVGTAALGAGLWGQLDMVGNIYDWNLDTYIVPYVNPCTDCANLSAPAANKGCRGGDFHQATTDLQASMRSYNPPTARGSNIGIRCARTP
ncbi:MAG: SUMF1/EgtB/PvdO family nonheme iron enzyme [Polyangiaceae bacterium]